MLRRDIENGRLRYSCNCGWIDLGHANPRRGGPHIGAQSLWDEICREAQPAYRARKDPNPIERVGKDLWQDFRRHLPPPHRNLLPDPGPGTWKDPYRLPNGQEGFLVTYRQEMSLHIGRQRTYVVSRGLTIDQKKSVALAIFIEVTFLFEGLQAAFPKLGIPMYSGFSAEDLVSNLLGFYVAVDGVNPHDLPRMCGQLGKEESYSMWDRRFYGYPWELIQNKRFIPKLMPNPGKPCDGQSCRFPLRFSSIVPARKGVLFQDWA
ncbi:hypothetical protein FHP25_30110 [Vineibacter terrae]|uniref:Uncharacterized protein n=1 Tax=Vineibacter terrae TaxID=2586908 RepID=A0A5C8PD57_9HYPH|nr:hypothetical protein [Vineibacter terrae]TXL71484.1 hypothetical protein FHP25_30110 [Vineibacter terrae]